MADNLNADGTVREKSRVREEVDQNGVPQTLYGTNHRVCVALDEYFARQLSSNQGIMVKHGAYRGLDPSSAIFLTEVGSAYGLTEKTLHSGVVSYSCNALGAYISRHVCTCGH